MCTNASPVFKANKEKHTDADQKVYVSPKILGQGDKDCQKYVWFCGIL